MKIRVNRGMRWVYERKVQVNDYRNRILKNNQKSEEEDPGPKNIDPHLPTRQLFCAHTNRDFLF
jgi:hypothetical protein